MDRWIVFTALTLSFCVGFMLGFALFGLVLP
jgi:hypothetical protein